MLTNLMGSKVESEIIGHSVSVGPCMTQMFGGGGRKCQEIVLIWF